MGEDAFRQPHTMTRRQEIIELGVFLLLILPPMILPVFGVTQENIGFATVAWATIIHDAALLALVLYFVWRNGEALSDIGIRWRGAWKEALLGLILFFPFLLGVNWIERLFKGSGLTAPEKLPGYLIPGSAAEIALALVLLVAVAVAEEVIFRGYLIRRFRALTDDVGSAVILATLVFSVGHGYQGSAGLATVAIMGLVFAGIYLWRGSLVLPIVLHFLNNFFGMIIAPLATGW